MDKLSEKLVNLLSEKFTSMDSAKGNRVLLGGGGGGHNLPPPPLVFEAQKSLVAIGLVMIYLLFLVHLYCQRCCSLVSVCDVLWHLLLLTVSILPTFPESLSLSLSLSHCTPRSLCMSSPLSFHFDGIFSIYFTIEKLSRCGGKKPDIPLHLASHAVANHSLPTFFRLILFGKLLFFFVGDQTLSLQN